MSETPKLVSLEWDSLVCPLAHMWMRGGGRPRDLGSFRGEIVVIGEVTGRISARWLCALLGSLFSRKESHCECVRMRVILSQNHSFLSRSRIR